MRLIYLWTKPKTFFKKISNSLRGFFVQSTVNSTYRFKTSYREFVYNLANYLNLLEEVIFDQHTWSYRKTKWNIADHISNLACCKVTYRFHQANLCQHIELDKQQAPVQLDMIVLGNFTRLQATESHQGATYNKIIYMY